MPSCRKCNEGYSKDEEYFLAVMAQTGFVPSLERNVEEARAQGKTLLRLKVVLDEAGWTLAPSASRGSPPLPTPDRL